ncbi:MAG: Tfp pilus assembly protein PilF [Myxococcota bacterium]|jgi:Tfp pilus assembly protein PilF
MGFFKSVKAALVVTASGLQFACMTPVLDADAVSESDQLLEQASARRDLGMNYLGKGQNAIALRELVFSVETNPNDPITQLWLGEGYRRQGHNDLALAAMLRSIELKPDFRDAHNNLAAFYIQLEDYENAIKHSQVLIDDPLYARPWKAFSNRGFAELRLGRIEDARKSLEIALEFRRGFWPASLNLGLLEHQAGQTVKAVQHFRKVIGSDVGDGPKAEATFHVGQILVSMGHREKAMKYFAASVKTDPDGRWAMESRNYLKILR